MAATKRHRVFLAREGLAAVEWHVEPADDGYHDVEFTISDGRNMVRAINKYDDAPHLAPYLNRARLLHKELGDFIKAFEGALGAARNDNKTATELTKRKGGRKNAAV